MRTQNLVLIPNQRSLQAELWWETWLEALLPPEPRPVLKPVVEMFQKGVVVAS